MLILTRRANLMMVFRPSARLCIPSRAAVHTSILFCPTDHGLCDLGRLELIFVILGLIAPHEPCHHLSGAAKASLQSALMRAIAVTLALQTTCGNSSLLAVGL